MIRQLKRAGICAALSVAFALLMPQWACKSEAAESVHPRRQFRRPVAIASADEGARLFVANGRSGTLTTIDAKARRVESETPVGTQLADLAITPNEKHILCVDQAANQLIVIAKHEANLAVIARLDVSSSPVSVAVSADGLKCAIALLWARRVTIVDLSRPDQPRASHVIDLPFAPRKQQLLADGKTLVVADSFQGRVALVDIESGKLIRIRSLTGHNIRGMTLSPVNRKLVVTHLLLDKYAETTQDGVHWGGVMSNLLRDVDADDLSRDSADPLSDVGTLFYLGYPDDATGDPSEIIVAKDGRRMILFAGVNEVAISDPAADYFERVPVGRRPADLALSDDGEVVFVVNTFSDSISMVQVDPAKAVGEISLGPQPEATPADRGEMLFHDARLSSDGWFSCHSCHADGHSNGLLNDNLGDGSFGAAKRVLSLLGAHNTGPWGWNGRVTDLEAQVRKSIETTMRGPSPSERDVRALAAYLRTLSPPPSLSKARGQIDSAAVERGRVVFQSHDCSACHEGPQFTSADVYDVGLEDELGNRRFNPPSLLGVSQREQLLHDNRAAGLEEVFDKYRHGLSDPLSPQERNDLLAYLRSL